MPEGITLLPVEGLPEITRGAKLGRLIVRACEAQGTPLRNRDILVVAQKIVSKSEGRGVDLTRVKPSPFATAYAATYEKDPRLIEVVLGETRRVSRMDRGVLITETHHGFTCANSGVDRSNVPGADVAMRLPKAPDVSAGRLREDVEREAGVRVAVVVTDTWGRPLRAGLTEFAIGLSGIGAIEDYRGKQDMQGRPLEFTAVAVADELAAAAGLLMRKEAGVPVVIVRGFRYRRNTRATAQALLREPGEDLFR